MDEENRTAAEIAEVSETKCGEYTCFQIAREKKAPEPLSWRDWAGPLAALILAALWCFLVDLNRWGLQEYKLGAGVTVFVFLYFIALMLLRRREKPDKIGLFYMIAALILALCRLLYSTKPIGSGFVLLCVTAAATFRLSGQCFYDWFDGRSFIEIAKHSVLALTSRIPRLFQALGLVFKQRERHSGFTLGLLIALPLLVIVLLLLSSSDQVFAGLFSDILKWLNKVDAFLLLWRIVKTLCVTLLLASLFCYIAGKNADNTAIAQAKKQGRAQALLPAAIALDIAYAVFVFIQIRFLFIGSSSTAMSDGWAQYARQGFFQLVAVAAINLLFCLISAGSGSLDSKGGKLLRAADLLMLAFSYVILASAVWRMVLYIRVYGLSLLRLETLWAIVLIAVLLATAAVMLFRKNTHFFKVLIVFGLSFWCLFCAAFPGKIIADYNISAYKNGSIILLDTEYLRELGPDIELSMKKAGLRTEWREPETWVEWHASFLLK